MNREADSPFPRVEYLRPILKKLASDSSIEEIPDPTNLEII